MRLVGDVARKWMIKMRTRVWVEGLKGRVLGRPRRRWVYNIEMDLGEIGSGDMGFINLGQCRNRILAFVCTVKNLWLR
jgi:hypothetical protein